MFVSDISDVDIELRNRNIKTLNTQFNLLRDDLKSVKEAYAELIETTAYAMVPGMTYKDSAYG